MVDDAHFGLYTGCLIRARLPHLEKSARLVFDRFGVQLTELEGATCCPDPVGVRGIDEDTWLAMAARNLAIARNNSRALMTLCSGCYNTFCEAQHLLAKHPFLREKVRHALEPTGYAFHRDANVEHFARYLFEEIGVTTLSSRTVNSWKGLPVALHQGCHFLRPTRVIAFDDPENPTKLEDLVRAVGAQVVDFPQKMLCCGFGIYGVDPTLSLQMAYEKLNLIKAYGARVVIVICPACMLQFDTNQRAVERAFGVSLQLPVFYLTEFVGLALGLAPASLGLKFHRIDASDIVREVFPDQVTGH